MSAPYFLRNGRIHEPANEYGLPIDPGVDGPYGVRRGLGGFHLGRCVCGWSVTRKRKVYAETKLGRHIDDGNATERQRRAAGNEAAP